MKNCGLLNVESHKECKMDDAQFEWIFERVEHLRGQNLTLKELIMMCACRDWELANNTTMRHRLAELTVDAISSLYERIDAAPAKIRHENAVNAAKAKNAADPKQKDKTFVFRCWQDWQKSKTPEKPKGNYSGKAEFARDMRSKCEELKSQKVIEDWCRGWEKPQSAS